MFLGIFLVEVSLETILVKICIQSFLVDVFLEVFRGGVLSWGLLLFWHVKNTIDEQFSCCSQC